MAIHLSRRRFDTHALVRLRHPRAAVHVSRRSTPGLSAIDVKTLSEAARSLGAGWPTVMLRVIVPNMSGAILNACLLAVALVLGEYTIANLLNFENLQVASVTLGAFNAGVSIAVAVAALAVHLRALGRSVVCRQAATQTKLPPPKATTVVAGVRLERTGLGTKDLICRTSRRDDDKRNGVEVRLEDLRRSYGGVTALDGLTLTMAPGELVALLGPSGCGKTTAMRLVAGLEEANSGRVDVRRQGRHRPACQQARRRHGVPGVLAFPAHDRPAERGVRIEPPQGRRQTSARRRAGEMLELVGLSAFADRYAHQLSGGQQQRVALARALAIQPTVLLLDEPLSALDAKVRSRLRDEIRRVQLEVGTTTLFVTHDQEEALAIADRVGVMNKGRLEQLDSPTVIYSRPATPFVAEFVGLTNRLAGRGQGRRGRGPRHPPTARAAGRSRRPGHRARAPRSGGPRGGHRSDPAR